VAALDPPLDILEIAISHAWHDRTIPDELTTTDCRAVRVIHRGSWTHGLGPDFRDAMIEFDGRSLVTGSVEMHRQTSGWRDHGHDRDPRYNDVILHVVLQNDALETRRLDGGLVPTVVVPGELVVLSESSTQDWTRVGGTVCAEDLAHRSPEIIRSVLWRLGDIRLAAKSARLEARLSAIEPAEVLYQELWDGLGFSTNREPMRLLASTLPLAALERTLSTVAIDRRLHVSRGLIFGVAGFLPLSPNDAGFALLSPAEVERLEEMWHAHGSPWRHETLSPLAWTRARVRPANHPVARLAAGAAIIANATGGLASTLLSEIRSSSDPAQLLRKLSASPPEVMIGEDRACAIVANGLIPFALALAEHTGDFQLSEATSQVWERLPSAGNNEVTRRARRQVAGSSRLPGLRSRGEQGLIHLDSTLCAPRRCRECPIAALVIDQDS
jgi:hypothetical protein